MKEILFTARKPFREEPYDELPKVENDLLIDDLEDEDCFDKPLISSSKPDKLVLVRKTQEDKASERLLIESIVKQMSRKEENKESFCFPCPFRGVNKH